MLLESERTGDALILRLRGAWCIENVGGIEAALGGLGDGGRRRVILDCGRLDALDLSGAWLLHEHLVRMTARGARLEFAGEVPAHFAFLEVDAAYVRCGAGCGRASSFAA